MKLPSAKKYDHKIVQHGYERNDSYSWLRDKNWKEIVSGNLSFENPEILEYINAENSYKDEIMSDYKDIEKKLYEEILSRINEDDQSYPVQKGEYFYYSREEKGKNYAILCRKKDSIDNKEEIFFDINKEAEGKKLFMFGPSKTNRDNSLFAYFYNLTGSMERTLKVRNLETGKDFDWEIENCNGSFEWIDNENLYYIERDEFARGKNIYRLNVNEGPVSKKLVYSKPEEYSGMFLFMGATNDKKYIYLELSSGATQVVLVGKNGSDEFKIFAKGENDISFSIDHYQDKFYILTNMDGANNFKVMSCSVNESDWDKDNWQQCIASEKNLCLDSINIYNDFLILVRKNNDKALKEIVSFNLQKNELNLINMPGEAYDLGFQGAWDSNSTNVRLNFNSPIDSSTTLNLDLLTNNVSELHRKDVPNFDPNLYVVKREYAKARDGEMIPLTIVHRKNLEKNASNNAFVYAYGSYGFGMPAYFQSGIFSLIDRGFVYCIAHIRGGDDKGYDWYLNGKMKNKMNTFNDFIDSCEHLVKEKYTTPEKMAINGGSAGGLLMGAVTNMRPDLFGAVVADVAFVDVINTISDASLPLTPPEWEEWGNPIEYKEDFEYMIQYSPYDNVKAQNYPPMLYNSGISDEQVTYWEPTKMVAKLRELKTDNNILLLNMKMHAGHAGATKKYEWIEERAFKFSFILKALNIKE